MRGFSTGSRSRRCLISQTIHLICQIQNSKFQQIMGTVSSNCQQTCSKGLKQLQKCFVPTTENQSWSSHNITEESLTLCCNNYIHLLHYFFITFNLFLKRFFLILYNAASLYIIKILTKKFCSTSIKNKLYFFYKKTLIYSNVNNGLKNLYQTEINASINFNHI